MATKSKKFKHSAFFKTLCFLLSVVFFSLSALSVLLCVYFYEYTGDITSVFSSEKLPPYRNSNTFHNLVYSYTDYAAHLTLDFTEKEIEAALLKEMDEQIEDNINTFLQKKAEIIRSELYYVATHYERQYEDDYYYNAYNELTTTTKPDIRNEEVTEATTLHPSDIIESTTVNSSAPVVEVDPYAPYNVRYCQHILNTVSGLDFLEYQNLVRDEALDIEENFTFNPGVFSYYAYSYGTAVSYLCTEGEVRNQLTNSYLNLVSSVQYQYSADMEAFKQKLRDIKNYKYLLLSGDKVYSNIPEDERSIGNITDHMTYGIYKDGKLTTVGLDNSPYSLDSGLSGKSSGDYTLYFYIEDSLIQSDIFYDSMVVYELYSELPPLNAVIMTISFLILAIVFLIVLINLCGHKNGCEETVTAFIDKLPCDIHFVINGAAVFALSLCYIYLLDALPYHLKNSRTSSILFAVVTAAVAGAAWALIIEWSTSFARLVKCGKKNSIIIKFIRFLKKLTKKLVTLCKKGFKLIFYKNVKLSVFCTVGIFIYFIVNIILSFLLNFSLGWIFVLIPYNIAVIVLVLLFMRHLDKIIKASEDIGSPIPDADKMPGALRVLANNISQTNINLQEAVEQTVKNERMKTDLITNVSHDLRTPLTAIISYVGLLEKCDISDPTAKEYLSVLSEKSEKLKHLINDLIEASKVSSGNVTLNVSELNLSELVVQATVEATPEFEKNGLEIRLSDSEVITVLADSAKTYRIIENLLSNARKYSAENSRVYITVSKNESYGIFEIKNISAEPLNIDADELMERFVRGDKSRSRDGNGLGLSIAKELCSVQGGKLSLSIDGDLFKATVYLPKK